MTPSPDYPRDAAMADDGLDRIADHQRQQLSALLDGELAPDEARFLLRRLQHDPELIGRWERWQQAGDILRGRVDLPVAVGFAQGVAAAIRAEPTVRPAANGSRRLRWGGAALAASAAMVALLLARQAPDRIAPETSAPIVATSDTLPGTPSAVPVSTTPAPTPDRTHGGQLAAALAVADVPRRLGARRSRAQNQRAAIRVSTRVADQRATSAVALATAPVDPFSGQHVNYAHRPWPKALLPDVPAAGAFTVEYGTRSVPERALYPFAPRNDGASIEPGP